MAKSKPHRDTLPRSLDEHPSVQDAQTQAERAGLWEARARRTQASVRTTRSRPAAGVDPWVPGVPLPTTTLTSPQPRSARVTYWRYETRYNLRCLIVG